MVKVRYSRQIRQEDFVCAADTQSKFIVSPKHIFAISTTIIVSVALVLPMHLFSPDLSGTINLASQEYLESDDNKIIADISSAKTADNSKENYEDYDLPSALFDSKDPIVAVTAPATAPQIDEPVKEVSQPAQVVAAVSDKKPGDAKKNALPRPKGMWYTQTVQSGDTLSQIFSYLSLPYATLNKLTAVAKKNDLQLRIGESIHFLVDNKNIVMEVVKPLDDNTQVRFTRMHANDGFSVVYEALNTHVDSKDLIKTFKNADTMPLAVAAQKERELREEQRQLAIKKEQERLKNLNHNPKRPRLVIASVQKGESFKKAAHRAGLTPTEIETIEKYSNGKLNLAKVNTGDSFRVLFNGIGTQALINAFEIKSQKQGTTVLYRNPSDGILYEEKGYTPSIGVFRRFPLAGKIEITSHFNPQRRHPVTRRIAPHKGVDFKASIGTPVYAPADGVVTFAGYQRAAGYYMIIRHQGDYSTVYMHLSKMEARRGQKVTVGQVIAKTGNTGRTSGPHLHYEIRINDRAVNPLKIDLPKSNHPQLALRQKEKFNNNVQAFKSDLYKDSLAKSTN